MLSACATLVLLLPQVTSAQSLSALTEPLAPLNYEVNGKVIGFSTDLLTRSHA
jgi:hypothetical protein